MPKNWRRKAASTREQRDFHFLLEGADKNLQLSGNIRWGRSLFEHNGCADAYGNFSKVRQPTALLLHLPDAIEPDGHDGQMEIFR